MNTFNAPLPAPIFSPHKISGEAFSEKLANGLAAIQEKYGYTSGLWVTANQAGQLGGFDNEFVMLRNGKERRPTANNSTALISGIKPECKGRGMVHKYYLTITDKKTGKKTSIPCSVTYYNVAQCYGVNYLQLPLILKWHRKAAA